MYKCGNDKCQRYLNNLEKLSPEEKIIREQKQSQFKLRYIYRDYKINLKEILNKDMEKPMQKLDQFRYSLNTICLALSFHVTLQLSTRQTAFALNRIFGIRISHMTVARIAAVAAVICHQFNLKNIPKVSGEQAADETYIKVKGKHHYIWLAVAKFRSIITAYFVSDNRGEIPAIITLNMAAEKHLKVNEEEPLLLGVDGNPSYMAATTFLKKQGIDIDLKQVIGLENKDEISAAYRDLKNLIERLNRTIKSQAHNNFQIDRGAASYTALAVTNYNFIRPHSSLNYQPPVVLDELKDTLLLQDVWSKILRSA
jgi:putative transposase